MRYTKNYLKQNSTSELIESLYEIRSEFNNMSASAKINLINEIRDRQILDPYDIEYYHDSLMFIRAYPESVDVKSISEKALQTFADHVDEYKFLTKDKKARMLDDSGIVNTSVGHTFSFDLIRSLARWFPQNIDIDWKDYNKKERDNISNFLYLLVAWQENDSLDNDLETSTEEYLARIAGQNRQSSLATLLKLLYSSGLPIVVQRYLYESIGLLVNWNLNDSPASRTFKRVSTGRTFYQNGPKIARTKDLRQTLKSEPAPLKRLGITQGKEYIRHIKEVLGVRCRELFPLMNSNPHEIYLYEPGRGVQIAVYGNNTEIRLPLESNFGAILVRNDIPVGYGIGCTLFDQVEIAINIFPAYRTGESSFIIEQFFKLFHHHFGSNSFLVRSYQVGDDNDEALESGSFWFYYKLGFRPVDQSIRAKARREAEKVRSTKGYRSPISVLKKLSRSDVFFEIDVEKMADFNEMSLANLGYVVTEYMAKVHNCDRQMGTAKSVEYLKKILKIKKYNRWTSDEKLAFDRLAPIICCIHNLNRWSADEKSLLAKLIKAKGSRRERSYVLSCNKLPKLRAEFRKLASGYQARK